MKKLALVLVLVAAIAAAGFAQVTLEPTLTGSATLTFGVDLDLMATGFANETEANIEITLVEEATEEKGGDGTVYGWIKLEDFSIVVDGDDGLTVTTPDISARLYMGPVYIDILGVDDAVDSAGLGAVIAGDVLAPTTLSNDYDSEYDGLAVVYDTDMFDFTVFVQSEADWIADAGSTTWSIANVVDADDDGVAESYDVVSTTTGANDANVPPNAYCFGLTAGVDIAGIAVGLAFNMGMNYGGVVGLGPIGFGADVAYGLALGDTTLTPYVGFDGVVLSAGAGFDMQVAGGVKLTWADMGSDAAEVDLLGDSSMATALEETEVTSGVALGANFTMISNVPDLDIKLAFYEDSGDDGLLPILGATAIVNFNGIVSGNTALGAGLNLNADLGMISPFAGMLMWTDAPMTTVQNLEMWVGTDVMIIDNTTFTLKYVSGNLLASEAGVITFATKVAF
ncbi:MAG: hypothetical protein ACOCYA_02325 [Spirochaetota bacterium]